MNLSEAVEETYRRAMSSQREETDELTNSVAANATSLAITGTQGSIDAAGILEVDYELYLVQGVSGANNPTIAVTPGYLDSTSASHDAGAVVRVNPRFPRMDILQAVNETIDSLSNPSAGLFNTATVTVTYNPVIIGYDLTDVVTQAGVSNFSLTDLIEVRSHEYGPWNKWPVIPRSKLRLQRNADTTIFPSGLALEVMEGGYPGRPVRILYKTPYTTGLTPANLETDLEVSTGLHSQAHDIVPMGAILRLAEWRDIKRAFTEDQSEPRKAQEVPVGSSETALKMLQNHYTQRVAEERSRLERMYRTSMR